MLKGRAVVAQSGGPTVVINASLAGVIEEASRHGGVISELLGSRHAVRGMRDSAYVSLSSAEKVSAGFLDLLAGTPSSALGSSRDKPDEAYCAAIVESFRRHDVRYFFYIGGNDSADTARIVAEMAGKSGHELTAVHIPKTIDNDLRNNDHTPGFGSAARFVALAFMGDELDNRALPGVKINVVMGRNAGFLTAAAGLARQYADAGPHLIYCPEVAFDRAKFVSDVQSVVDRLGRCVVAVSEGVAEASGREIAVVLAEQSGGAVERDSHGNVQLSGSGALGDALASVVKAEVKFKGKPRVRADTFGYLQRSFAGCVSPVDASEAREVGRLAVRYAVTEGHSGTVTINRAEGPAYRAVYAKARFADVAREARHMPRSYLNEAGNDVTEAFLAYARPVVGDLPAVATL